VRVSIDDIDVLCVVAEGGPAGGPAAFGALEAAIGGPRGRKFYATYHDGEYRACAALRDGDDPQAIGLAVWRIPGGEYERRKLVDWQERLDEIPATFEAMADECRVDDTRPSVEYYRSARQVVLLLPVK
jgi:hypothetical protein